MDFLPSHTFLSAYGLLASLLPAEFSIVLGNNHNARPVAPVAPSMVGPSLHDNIPLLQVHLCRIQDKCDFALQDDREVEGHRPLSIRMQRIARKRGSIRRTEPETDKVHEAAAALTGAERPVIVAGGGVIASSAEPAILELAEMLSIPVATSLGGKGAILDAHPLCVGVVGSYSRRCANRVVSEADLVLFIGSHTGDQVTNDWTVPGRNVAVIQIDIDPSELGRSYPNTVPLMGDARATVQRMKESLGRKKENKPWIERAQSLVKEWKDEAEPLRRSDATPIRPERLCKEISEALPSNGILVADTGNAGIWTGTMVYLTQPGQSYLRSAGSLGWAFPASLGAKCGAPERPVLCFTGDGGFYYHLSELETASRCGIKTVTVVNNNHSFSQVMGLINRAYEGRSGKKDDLYKFQKVDFAQIARGMGCFGVRVEKPEEISNALKEAFASDLPALVDVVTDPNCRAESPWKPPA